MNKDLDEQILSFLRRIHDEEYLEHFDDIVYEGLEYFYPCDYPNFKSYLDDMINGSVMTFILGYIDYKAGEEKKGRLASLYQYVTDYALKLFTKKIKSYYDSTIEDLRYDGVECPKVTTDNTINENVVTRSDIESSISNWSQHQRLKRTSPKNESNFDLLKKLIFKYWDTNGLEIDKSLTNLFQTRERGLSAFDIQNMLIEYIGIDNVVNIVNEFLQKEHFINPDGGSTYQFSFIADFEFLSSQDLFVKCYVNAKDGMVTIDGVRGSLEDAVSNTDYGWEVKSEIGECIDDYFRENIINKIGVRLYCSEVVLGDEL